ncbi:hypothetical protein C8J57DRAFT_1059566, partial [Mycena rebaudengoi]
SAVRCEHIFSSSAETTTTRRNMIAPELMKALQTLKFSVKKSRGLNYFQRRRTWTSRIGDGCSGFGTGGCDQFTPEERS